jgi:hypothetical protein
MKSVVGIEVLANRIGMECNEEDVEEVGRNELEANVQQRSCNWLEIDQYFVLDDDARMPKGGAVIVINARCFEGFVADCARTLDKSEDRAHDGIAGVGLDLLVLVKQFDANRAIEECLRACGRSGILTWTEH